MNSIESCTNTSVGILVQREDRLLLIERARPPYGWAAPAGHVDNGELPIQAAARGLFEEVGLRAVSLTQVLARCYHNQCRRPGGSFHRWKVYRAVCDEGDPTPNPDEVATLRWVTQSELDGLTRLASEHLAADAESKMWQRWPGLQPVWMAILSDLGMELG